MASIQKTTLPMAQYHTYQGNTRDCGPHALATLYNGMMGHQVVTPEWVGAQLKGRMWGATPPWSMVRWLKWHGLSESRWYLRGTRAKLLHNIARDTPTIVGIAGWPWAHWKVLHGYWESSVGIMWSFVDSAYDEPTSYQLDDDFMREWGTLLRVTVEAG